MYLAHAIRAIVAILALRGMNKLRACSGPVGSNPTRASAISLGAVAELERSLTVERVRAGLWDAKAKGKSLGRPRVAVDVARIVALRMQELS